MPCDFYSIYETKSLNWLFIFGFFNYFKGTEVLFMRYNK